MHRCKVEEGIGWVRVEWPKRKYDGKSQEDGKEKECCFLLGALGGGS